MKITIHCQNKQVTTEITSEESLLESALRAEMNPPYSCLEGVCRTCEAYIIQGSVIEDSEEKCEGTVVRTCMSRPKSDLTISYDKTQI